MAVRGLKSIGQPRVRLNNAPKEPQLKDIFYDIGAYSYIAIGQSEVLSSQSLESSAPSKLLSRAAFACWLFHVRVETVTPSDVLSGTPDIRRASNT
eukprot:6172405-Pleurochrysis_carterae.AAC.1